MSTQSVQCFGKKKTATAVAHCKVRAEPLPNTWRVVPIKVCRYEVSKSRSFQYTIM